MKVGHRGRESGATPSAARRERDLLEQLRQIVVAEGFLHLRTEDLARRLRCSKRALYALAPSRDALFERLAEEWFAHLRERGHRAADEASSPSEAVVRYLGVAIEEARDTHPRFLRDVYEFEGTHARLLHHQRERIAGLEKLVAEGVRAGVFREIHPALLADVLLHAVARLVDPEVLDRLELSMPEAFRELYDIVEFGLLVGEPERRS